MEVGRGKQGWDQVRSSVRMMPRLITWVARLHEQHKHLHSAAHEEDDGTSQSSVPVISSTPWQ